MNKICINCNIEHDINEYTKNKKYKDGHIKICKICEKVYRNTINNNLYKKEYNKNYIIKNKDKLNIYHKEYKLNRKKNDPLYKLTCDLRRTISDIFKKNGYRKNSKTTNILGCSFEEFKIYIELQFESWMTWDNHGIYTGNYNETWQLDHITAISHATNEQDIIKLNHHMNFRPLCSKLNLEKSNKDFIQ